MKEEPRDLHKYKMAASKKHSSLGGYHGKINSF